MSEGGVGGDSLESAKGEDPTEVLAGLRKALNILIVMTVVLYAAAMLVMLFYIVPAVNKTNDALCTFRGDLQTRVVQTQEFLRDHPEGFPGVPAAQLQQSLTGQIRTVNSLSSLDCPPPEPTDAAPPDTTPDTTGSTVPKE